MNQYYNEINRFIDTHKGEMMKRWKTLMNMEGHYDEKENMERTVGWLKNRFKQEGLQCRIHEVMKGRVRILVGVLGSSRPGKPVIFSGRIDTIHHNGSFGKENPFEIRDGKAYSPDMLDMKGGVIISLHVVKTLDYLGYNEHPIKILYTGERELDRIGNDADIFYTEESKKALRTFSIETGHVENRLCMGHKTQYTVRTKAHELGGHAGDEFTKGEGAVHEAIFKAAKLTKLTDPGKGTTVAVSAINSGMSTNTTSIPDLGEFAIDIHIFSDEIGKKVLEDVDQIMKKMLVEGTTTEYYVDLARLHPFEPNPQVMCLLSLVNQVAAGYDLAESGQIQLDGTSDAGAIAAAGIPVLCSCGPIGRFNHDARGYVVVDSLPEHAKIYALTATGVDKL